MTDMTTSDLKAAAERLRRVLNGEPLRNVYPLMTAPYREAMGYAKDQDAVLSSVLATQQQDGGDGPSHYEQELQVCADIVQRVHPIGEVKAIGLLEVATALGELFPGACTHHPDCRSNDGKPCDWSHCRVRVPVPTTPAPDAAITEGWLREIGFAGDDHGQLRIARKWEHSPYPTYLVLSDPPNILESPWSLQTYFDDGTWEGTMIAEQITTQHQLLSLLDSLGVPVKKDAEVANG